MQFLYHIIIVAALIAASPYLLFRAATDASFRNDMAHWLDDWKSAPFLTGCIWIHASSAGEVRVAKTLIQGLKEEYKDNRQIILSTFTLTGYELAKSDESLKVLRLPPDLQIFMQPLLERLDPSLLILVESELWPCLLRLCLERNVPVLLLNGRMSKKSFRRYKFIRPLFQWLTEGVTTFAMRSQLDADHILKLGVAKERALVTGNMKFDAAPGPGIKSRSANEDANYIVFVSTRPGDEEPVLDAISQLRKEVSGLKYALAPRHLHRLDEIKNLIAESGLEFTLHSSLSSSDAKASTDLVLIDEMGKLDQYYANARAVFVGGSFSPEFGGHNILEPALYSLPVLFGKHMNNFLEETRLLVASGGGLQIEGPEDLFPTLHRLIAHNEEIKERGEAAFQTILQNQGATKNNIELIHKTLNKTPLAETTRV